MLRSRLEGSRTAIMRCKKHVLARIVLHKINRETAVGQELQLIVDNDATRSNENPKRFAWTADCDAIVAR